MSVEEKPRPRSGGVFFMLYKSMTTVTPYHTTYMPCHMPCHTLRTPDARSYARGGTRKNPVYSGRNSHALHCCWNRRTPSTRNEEQLQRWCRISYRNFWWIECSKGRYMMFRYVRYISISYIDISYMHKSSVFWPSSLRPVLFVSWQNNAEEKNLRWMHQRNQEVYIYRNDKWCFRTGRDVIHMRVPGVCGVIKIYASRSKLNYRDITQSSQRRVLRGKKMISQLRVLRSKYQHQAFAKIDFEEIFDLSARCFIFFIFHVPHVIDWSDKPFLLSGSKAYCLLYFVFTKYIYQVSFISLVFSFSGRHETSHL